MQAQLDFSGTTLGNEHIKEMEKRYYQIIIPMRQQQQALHHHRIAML